jgi:hypothetical protein
MAALSLAKSKISTSFSEDFMVCELVFVRAIFVGAIFCEDFVSDFSQPDAKIMDAAIKDINNFFIIILGFNELREDLI